MGPFLTPVELARVLKMPVRSIEKLEIHKCGDRYHVDVVNEFCSKHNLPMLKPPKILGVRGLSGFDDNRVRWHSNIEEALIDVDVYTRVLIYSDEIGFETRQRVWSASHKFNQLRIVLVGTKNSNDCHIRVECWDDAVKKAEGLI